MKCKVVIKSFIIILLASMLLTPISVSAFPDVSCDQEQKVYSNVSIEDNFADDRLVVVIDQKASKELKDYIPDDFPELDVKSVNELTINTKNLIKAIKEKDTGYNENGNAFSKTDFEKQFDVDRFKQIIAIELNQSGKSEVIKAITTIQDREDIFYAGPDYEIAMESTAPNDYYYSEQWASGLIKLEQAWDYSTGSASVYVGVLDSGIDGSHEDLENRIDNNKHRDFTSGNMVNVNTPTDPRGHGTHVAGILGAQGNNGIGVCGVCWNINLVSLRVFDSNGQGLSSYVEMALDYANANNIPIVNFSGGWEADNERYDVPLDTSINNYYGLVVCAAGNSSHNTDNNAHYPSAIGKDNIISVGGCNRADTVSDYSNFGITTVDLFAPGGMRNVEYVLSCYPNGNYASGWGTSMASPFVAGVAALIKSVNPSLSTLEIKAIILNTVDISTAYSTKCVSKGRLNAYKAVKAAYENNSCKNYLFSASTHTLQKYLGNNATLTLPSTINGEPCSTIANNAFKDNSSILSITIPNGVTSIGNSSFQGCVNLSSINLPTSLTSIGSSAFKNCTSLTSVVVPNQVSSLSNFIFAGCSSLENLTLPSGVNNIGAYIVNFCDNLKKLELPSGISTIHSHAFGHNNSLLLIVQKNSTTEATINNRWNYLSVSGSVIKEYKQGTGFIEGESQITNLTLPTSAFGTSLTSISNNNNLFINSSVVTSVEIPSSVTSINNNAFSTIGDLLLIVNAYSLAEADADDYGLNCLSVTGSTVVKYRCGSGSTLTHFTIPHDAFGTVLTGIGNYAFKDVAALETIDMLNTITSVGQKAFQNCTSLTSVSMPSSITSIGTDIFDGCSSEPLVVTEINSTADSYASNIGQHLMTVSLNGGTYRIDLYETSNPNYSDVVIPEKYKGVTITSIGAGVFNGEDVYEVTIPETIESIGSGAFSGCGVLFYVNIYSMTCTIGNNAFYNCPYLDLYVLHGSTARTYAVMHSLLYHYLD